MEALPRVMVRTRIDHMRRKLRGSRARVNAPTGSRTPKEEPRGLTRGSSSDLHTRSLLTAHLKSDSTRTVTNTLSVGVATYTSVDPSGV